MSKTTYVIICGMHRSGTSMLAGALGLCGLDIGANFRPPPYHPGNPKGYFEDMAFRRLNLKMMRKAGIGPGSFNLPDDFVIRDGSRSRQRLLEFLQSWDYGHPVGWKDPRACLTLKVWKKYIPNLKVIVIERPYAEIAASLKTRNGFSEDHSRQVTRIYLSQLKIALKGVDYRRVKYHDFLESQKKCHLKLEKLCGWIGLPTYGWEKEVDAFVDEKLWRHKC